MRSRGEGKRRGISACLGVVLAFLMVTAPGADYRTLYGDGLWHDMGGGWWYAYNTSLNDCYWRYSGVTRFAYDYDGGQWWDYRSSWGSLGASGIMDDDFIGDGTWHSLNNGWTFAYNKSISDSYFNTGSAVRFGYDYDGGQWWHYRTSWYTLGASGVSQSFVGDGAWHSLNDGWSYAYNKGLNDAYWNTGSALRFSYDYDSGLWWHYRTSWYTLGASGVSQQFIGDGALHSLNDGWLYAFNKALNDAYWDTGSATRFSYDYDNGQWWHYSISWSTLGASGVSQSFVGDGAWHDLNDGWSYAYNKALDDAYWNTGSTILFSYDYNGRQWWHYRTSWYTLGASGVSQQFIGDGAWHTLNDDWYYAYNKSLNDAYWSTGNGSSGAGWSPGDGVRFSYDYDDGQWWHFFVLWSALSATSSDPGFVGNGLYHDLNNGWYYQYLSGAGGRGTWTPYGSSATYLSYDYEIGQWMDFYGGQFHLLGLSNHSAVFMGDGNQHSFTGGGSYYYAGGCGHWHYGDFDIYRIDYETSTLYLWDLNSTSWKNMISYTSNLGTPTSVSNPEIRYVGDWIGGRFVETRLCYWGGSDYDIVYDYVAWSSFGERTWLTDWAIFNPGSDRIWSGTNGLKIGFLIYDGRSQWEDSKEDVIHFYDIDKDPKNYTFVQIVQLIHRMTQFYGTLADIVAITQHGLPDELGIGTADTVTSSNVSSYASLFMEWGTYMKTTGQIHFNHCLIAACDNPPGEPYPYGWVMLDDIAAYTGADVFASDDKTQIGPPQWPSNPNGYDWYMEYASNGNSLSYNCIYNYNTTNDKPYDDHWWE